MDITQEKVDDLNAILKVKLEANDYSESYNEALKTTRKQAQMQGFRKGMVPMGLVKKMYGKSILADEINKVLGNSIQEYIANEKLDILGSPLPKDGSDSGDWDNPGDFEFAYEIGLAPSFDLTVDKKNFAFHEVNIDDEMIDKQINDLARRYGSLSDVEESGDKDLVYGDFIELNEEGEIKEGGILHQSSISLEFIENQEARQTLVGKKKGDMIVVNPFEVSRGDSDVAGMLGIDQSKLSEVSRQFNFRVGDIKRLAPAEVNQELYDKVYGENEVPNSDDFRNRVEEDLKRMFVNDSQRMFQRDVSEALLDEVSLDLPDEFLKRWIKASNEKEITDEEIENEYTGYAVGLRWQLIKNRLIGDNKLEVTNDEILDYTKGAIANQYAQYGLPAPEDDVLTETANKSLANQDDRRRTIDTLFDSKVMQFIKENAQIENKQVSYDDFVNLAQGKEN